MPGLVGYVAEDATRTLLADMADALDSDSRFRVDLHTGQGFGLGRVSLGSLNPAPQPIMSTDQTLCLVMEGEFYNSDVLETELAKAGQPHSHSNDAELAVALIQAFGFDWVPLVNGAFVLALWDAPKQRLHIVNDRLGLFPLYYATPDDKLLFGSGVRVLMQEPSLARTVDRVAMAEFLTFDHVLGQRTLLEAARLLEQGSVLTFDNGRLSIESYWVPEHPQTYELRSEDEWADDLMYHLRQAVRRQAKGAQRPGLLLSGGLDSRVLLALMREEEDIGTFRTFTWGIPGCDDARFAKELASDLNVPNDFYELRPDWLKDLGNEAVRITDGLANVANMHALATVEQESERADILFKGFLGDAMMGFAFRPLFWADYDDETRFRVHFQNYLNMRVLTFTPDQQAELFSADVLGQVQEEAWEEFKTGMAESKSSQLANQRIHFDLRQRVPRMTIKGVEVARSRVAVRLPFADNDLVEFTFRVPPGYWYERRLMRTAFISEYPNLAKVPLSNDGLPMLSCARDLRLRTERFARWHLNRVGFSGVTPTGQRPYKDYDSWFRTTLAPWVKDNLLSDVALGRGYFNPSYVRRIVDEHMAGANYGGKIGALMSLELWHQQFID